MLNLNDPPETQDSETHPHIRLVPDGPPVRFRVPEDPVAPWWVRTIAVALGVIISGVIVLSIFFFGAFIKHVYDTLDAEQKAREEERRAAPPTGPEGSIPVVIPEDQPTADDPVESAPETEPSEAGEGAPPT